MRSARGRKKTSVKRNPKVRTMCGFFESPATCLFPRNESENPQTSWYTTYYDCATCAATVRNRERCIEREREAMRSYA